jgi:hypothetical protein
MPLVGAGHSLNLVGDEAPYFTSLEELDSWMDKPSRKLRSVLPYTPRSRTASLPQHGQLLVCHDYKVKPIPTLRTAFICELSTRGDIRRNPRHSHTLSISGHSVRRLSSRCHVDRYYRRGVPNLHLKLCSPEDNRPTFRMDYHRSSPRS